MTETFTLVHLSDVHLGPMTGLPLRHLNTKRTLGLLNWQRTRRFVHQRSVVDKIVADALAHTPDHIAVTGDLANLGLPGEFANALLWLQTLGDPTQVSVVPGNHDIYSGRIGSALCLETWAPYMQGDDSASENAPVRFPYVRKRGAVALIGLNSAEPTPPFVAAGRLGEAQIKALAPLLDRLGKECYVRVVLIHHPPLPGQASPRRALQDAMALADVLERHGAEVVLHGHNHRQMLAWRRFSDRGFPVLGVASASAARAQKHEPFACYRLLRIRRESGATMINCETRGLAQTDGEVVSLARQDLVMP